MSTTSPTVLITGALGPLGRALVVGFKDAGYLVTATDLHEHDLAYMEHTSHLAERCGEVDVVVNNAKVNDWRHLMTLGGLARRSIVNIGSIYGALGPDPKMYEDTEVFQPPPWYAAQKGALVAITRYQATTMAPVRSNCVCPGGIERGHSPEFKRRYEAKVPLKRMASEADIVPVVLFLAGEGASYITGQCIMVDGGMGVRT